MIGKISVTFILAISCFVILAGCGHKDGSQINNAPTVIGKNGVPTATVSAPAKSGDTKVLTDTQQAVQIENSDGGTSPK